MRPAWALALPVVLAACAHDDRAFTQADADAVIARCKAPKNSLWVEGDGGVRFEPPMDMDFDAATCVLKEIKEAGVTKFGFIGNEKAPEAESE